jgi:hypothetical protein
VKHTLEFLICGTIGAYCVWRFVAVMPAAIQEAYDIIFAYLDRVQEIETIIEEID